MNQSTPLLARGEEPVIILGAARAMFAANGRARRVVAGGAVTVSGLYIINWKKPFDGSDLVIDFVNDVVKNALYTNTITPNFSTDTGIGSAPYTSNEVTGTGYTAGGVTLASKTVTESPTGSLMFDAADPAWTGATFSGARCSVAWDDTATTPADPVLCLVNFGADFQVTAGTFTEQLAATGMFAMDITP